jgi:argininosuccinate lyase
LQNTKINPAACAAAASDPGLLATDLADYLVNKGMAFRQAHHVVGAVVALAEKTGKPLNKLTLKELKSVDKKFSRDAPRHFDPAKRHGQTKSDRRTGNEGSGEATGTVAEAACVK